MSDDVPMILRPVANPKGLAGVPDFLWWCPGCRSAHGAWIAGKNKTGALWSFDGNLERPTFSPSFLTRYNGPDAGKDGAPPAVCHTYVTEGRIQFLSDCTHDFAGKTVDMVAF